MELEISKRYLVNINNQHRGPYSKDELRELIDEKEISFVDFLCEEGKRRWVRIVDHEDFQSWLPSAPISIPGISPEEEEKSEKVFQFEDFGLENPVTYIRVFERAAYSAKANIECEGQNYQGNCTTIGQGGCFIEFDPKNLFKGQKVKLKIIPDLVPIGIDCEAEVASVVLKRPRGVGFKFINLPPQTSKKIKSYVDQYLRHLRR